MNFRKKQLLNAFSDYFYVISMPMPLIELTESDLNAYLTELSYSTLCSRGNLRELSDMYSRFGLNEQNLINFEYHVENSRIENDYIQEKERCQRAFDDLKQQYKQIDNRIISVEQKLSRGIPEDLQLIDKLIAEQEAIVQEQENLNAAESELKKHITSVDITYGKTGEKLRQNRIARLAPIKSRFEQFTAMINKNDQKIKSKTNIFALFVVIGVPLLLEFVAGGIRIPTIASADTNHGAPAHYLFISSLLLMELFFAERVRNRIYAFFAIRYATTSLDELAKLLAGNLASIAALEKKSGIKLHEIKKTAEQIEP